MGKFRYDPFSELADEFICDDEIMTTIAFVQKHKDDVTLLEDIMALAKQGRGLNHVQAALLLACDNPQINQEIFALAKKIKLDYYGNRIVLFAPLYLSNYCVNSCVYCPYHVINKHVVRKKLSQREIFREVVALQEMGHKRLALELGEDDINNPIDYVLESIDTIYAIKHDRGAIRRVNVNIAATTVENYRMLKDAGIGTYILFQETYNRLAYERLHPRGPKHDYRWHTEAMDRAMDGGIDDVGIGVLFGLSNYLYEFIAILMHAEHLETVFGVGPHTISVPRLRTADGINPADFKECISDETFAKIVACLRIAVPYTGMIVSTRESQQMRERVLELGVSQISGGSKTSVGGYREADEKGENSAQFEVSDNRSLDEIVYWLLENGHIPSFCTACYRQGRTGDRFMELCKSKQIHNFCHPNALMTLQEYLTDYATEKTRLLGEQFINEEIKTLTPKIAEITQRHLEEIRNNVGRDFRF